MPELLLFFGSQWDHNLSHDSITCVSRDNAANVDRDQDSENVSSSMAAK